jgi:hypothetical protein
MASVLECQRITSADYAHIHKKAQKNNKQILQRLVV